MCYILTHGCLDVCHAKLLTRKPAPIITRRKGDFRITSALARVTIARSPPPSLKFVGVGKSWRLAAPERFRTRVMPVDRALTASQAEHAHVIRAVSNAGHYRGHIFVSKSPQMPAESRSPPLRRTKDAFRSSVTDITSGLRERRANRDLLASAEREQAGLRGGTAIRHEKPTRRQ